MNGNRLDSLIGRRSELRVSPCKDFGVCREFKTGTRQKSGSSIGNLIGGYDKSAKLIGGSLLDSVQFLIPKEELLFAKIKKSFD